MQQTQRISKLFKDLNDGSPWLGVNINDTLKDISAEQASKRIVEGRNTIWEIVNHMAAWRLNVLERVQGKTIANPSHNYILPVEDTSQPAWENAKKQLKATEQEWLDFLENFDEGKFSEIYSTNKMTYYEHIHGILQHDAYHLGQIVLLSKIL